MYKKTKEKTLNISIIWNFYSEIIRDMIKDPQSKIDKIHDYANACKNTIISYDYKRQVLIP